MNLNRQDNLKSQPIVSQRQKYTHLATTLYNSEPKYLVHSEAGTMGLRKGHNLNDDEKISFY